MSFDSILTLGQTALELGLISSLTVLALFLSYSMLNVCDLSTDGCFTLGAVVGASVALSGHPFLAIPAAMAIGMVSGFVTALLQTKMGIDSLLAGIIVNTALYSVNIGIMNGASLLNLNNSDTVFTKMRSVLENTPLAGQYKLIVITITVILVAVILGLFLRTRLGLAIRATGNNPDMVRSSSINPVKTTIIGLCISNAFTALSGCLLAQSQKSVSIDIGTGMVTVALSSAARSSARAKFRCVSSAWSSVRSCSALCIPSRCDSTCPRSCSSSSRPLLSFWQSPGRTSKNSFRI